jgi:RNA-binding protein
MGENMERRRVVIRSIRKTAKKTAKKAAAVSAKKAVPMTPKRIQYLKGLGHGIDPVLSVGKDGITEGVVKACSLQLKAHELIKVRVQPEAPEERKDTAAALAEQTLSTLVQVLGRTFLLYKRSDKPVIELP